MTSLPPTPAPLTDALAARYALRRELGAGGMAVVYLADDVRHGRPVAVKVLRAVHGEVLGAERFHREIRVLAQLRHPFILPLHDSGEAAGALYFVMPYIDGESLRSRLSRETALPVHDALEIIRQVADAAHYAHGEGVVHRDIKPENILLTRHGHALLADFGIARSTPGGTDATQLTEAGLAIGTTAYMSPEQALGQTDVDGRTDTYALACVLFEMLAGRPPYQGANHLAVVAQHLTAPVPALTPLRPDVPPAVERAVAQALAKQPQDRFGTVADFVRALGAGSGPLLATDRAGAGAALSIAVLPMVTIGGGAEDEYFGEGLSEELTNALAKLEGLRVVSRASAFSFRGRQVPTREVGQSLGVAFVLEGSVRRAGARVRLTVKLVRTQDDSLLWSETYDREVVDVFAVQDEVTASVTDVVARTLQLGHLRGQVPVAKPASLEAYDLYLLGRHHWYRRTKEAMSRAVELFEQALGVDPAYAPAHAGLADALMLQASWQFAEPAEMYPRAAAAARRAIELAPDSADAHASLGFVKMNWEWDWDGAVRHLTRAIELNPNHETAHRWLSAFLAGIGRHDEALAIAERVPRLDPVSVLPLMNLGIIHQLGGRMAESEQAFRRVLERDPGFVRGMVFLGCALGFLGRQEEAMMWTRRAVERSPGVPILEASIGWLHAIGGDREAATAVLERVGAGITGIYAAYLPALFGEHDAALDALERAAAEHADWMYAIGTQPWFRSLRGHPRFVALLDRLQLPRPAA